MKKTILMMCLALMTSASFAIDAFIISDIKVEGVQRLNEGTVFNYLPLKVGDELNDEEARISLKALFATGFFKDVALDHEGTVLIVKVVERPSIASVTIEGNDNLSEEDIKSGLDQANIVAGRIFNQANLNKVEKDITDIYLSMGRYSATVDTKVEDVSQNRVDITFNIQEGRPAKIKKINIIGANGMSEKSVLKQMRLKSKKGLNPFGKKNQYSRQKLEADLESIRSYYLDNGFYDFEITSSHVDISPNKQNIFISISVEEGSQFSFGKTEIESGDEVDSSELAELVTIESGEPFSRTVVNETRSELIGRYADEGYAFVSVTPTFDINRDNQIVNTVFTIDPKYRVYVRKINITGNLFTRDEVIRRELRQFEGSWYSAESIRLSEGRLQRLGFFESVQIETAPVPGVEDQIDLTVIVKELDTGSLQFSIGYADNDGAILGAQYQQRNLFGSGRELNVNIDSSDTTDSASIAYVNPYHTQDGISRAFRISTREIDAEEAQTAEYIVNTNSAGVKYTIPIAESNSFNIGFDYEKIELQSTPETPPEILTDINLLPEADNFVMRLGVTNDTRNDFYFPTKGHRSSISLETGFPGSDVEYYKVNLDSKYYFPLTKSITVKVSAGIGYGDGYGDSSETGLPFYKNYFAGGTSTVRGFDSRSLGPQDTGATPSPLGGDKRVLANFELLFPPFGAAGAKDKRIGYFIDAGMVFATEDKIDLGELRYSTGLTFNWRSAVGPFSLSLGFPLNDEPGDDLEKIQFTLGSVFR